MFSSFPIDALQNVILSLPVAMCLVNREAHFIAANDKYAAILGQPLSALPRKPMSDFCTPEMVANARRDFATFDMGQMVPDHEITINGHVYLVGVSPLDLGHEGRATAVAAILTDISDLKQTEIALAASNKKLALAHRQLEALAETDPLTGLLNRRGLVKVLDDETRRMLRGHPALSVAMIDVDWFKPFNDLYGHVAGDAALQAVSAAILSALHRPTDWAARYGGEEFAVILPNTPRAGAEHIARAMKQAVHDLAIPHAGSPLQRITISVGIASAAHMAASSEPRPVYEGLLQDADRALYDAKRNGRNRISVAGAGLNALDR